MPTSSSTQSYTFPEGYYPDQPLVGGGVPGTILAGENAVLEANGRTRAIGAPTDIVETYLPPTLAYTGDLTAFSDIMLCSGGATLTTDFVPFQHFLHNGVLYLIEEILNNTDARISPTPDYSAPGGAIQKVLNIHAVEYMRATMFAGNVIKYREEMWTAVGNGEVKKNGASFSAAFNTNLTRPIVAYPIPGGTTYDVRPSGFTKPAAPTAAAVGGGTKNMPAVNVSLKVSKKRFGFAGYGLASDAVEVTLAAGDRVALSLGAFDATQGQTSWYIWATKTKVGKGQSGPWFLFGESTTASGTINIEWRDDELTEQLVDNNYPPPAALYTFSFNDLLCYASCYGKPDNSGNPTAPGPGIAVGKPNNPESFPPKASAFTTPADNIRGAHAGEGAAYLMTINNVSQVTLTGDDKTPLTIRPRWHQGCRHQYNGVMVGGNFYCFVGQIVVRIIDGQVDADFCVRVKSDLDALYASRVFLGNDVKNGWLVIFHANHEQRSGRWVTKCMIFNYKTGIWSPPVILSSGSTDFTVTSCAMIGDRLFFTTQEGKVWKWDDSTFSTVTGFIATYFNNFGSSRSYKTAREIFVDGRMVTATLSIYKDYDYAGLLADTSTVRRTFFPSPTNRQHLPVWKPNYGGKSLALRLSFIAAAQTTNLMDCVEIDVHIRDRAGY